RLVIPTKIAASESATITIPYGAFHSPVSKTSVPCVATYQFKYILNKTKRTANKCANHSLAFVLLCKKAKITPAAKGRMIGITARLVIFIPSQLFHIVCSILLGSSIGKYKN